MTKTVEPQLTSLSNARSDASPAWPDFRFDLLACSVLTVLFTSIIFQYLRYRGRLLIIPTYDDVAYLSDALARYNTWLLSGFPALLRTFWTQPPHSPFTTVLALVAYALLGPQQSAPYIASGIIDFVLICFICYLMRGARRWERILAAVFVLSIRISGNAVAEFRPDIASALFTCISIILLIDRPIPASNQRLLLGGVFLAIALLTKTPAFPNTLALGCMAIGLAGFREWINGRPIRAIAKDAFKVIGPIVILASPYYFRHGLDLIAYIRLAFDPSNPSGYRYTNLKEQVTYYLVGYASQFMLGRDFYMLAILVATGAVAIWFKRSNRLHFLSLACMLLAAFGIAVVCPLKQEFVACTFQILLIFSAVIGVRVLLAGAMTRIIGQVLLCISVIVGAWGFQWPNMFGTPGDPQIVGWNAAAYGIDELIRRNSQHMPHPHVFVGGVSAVSSDAIRFLSLQRLQEAPDCVMPVIDDPAVVARELEIADFVVASDDGVCTTAQYVYPSNLAQQRTLDAVRACKDFQEIGFFPLYDRRGYHLFQNIMAGDPFAGVSNARGLGGPEGPYPRWHLPVVRWGLMPETSVPLPSGRIVISVASQEQFPNQHTTFLVDGIEVAQCDYPKLYTFYVTTFGVQLASGADHVLTIRYRTSDPSSGRAVLFRQLAIHVAPTTQPIAP